MAALPAPDFTWLDGDDVGGDAADFALLDWLVPGDVPGAAAALEWPSEPAQLRLRCLDSSHPPGCVACLPPPPAAEESLYALRAGGGSGAEAGPSGSSRLRAQLLATAEWNSAAARTALAAAEEARGDPAGVVAILRHKRAKALLKPHMFLLLRAWGYASDLWRRRGAAGGSRKRVRAAGGAASRGASLPPHAAPSEQPQSGGSIAVPRPPSTVEKLSLSPRGEESALRALWRSSADCFLGTACRSECSRAGVAFFNATLDAEYADFDAGAARLVAQFSGLQAAQRRWNRAVHAQLMAAPAEDDAERATRLQLPASRLPLCVVLTAVKPGCQDVPAEEGLHCLLASVAAFDVAWTARRASACQAQAASASWLDMAPIDAEIAVLYAQVRRFIAEGLLVLQYLKARGSCGDYLDAAADVAHELLRFIETARANMADQRAWYARQCASGALAPLAAQVTPHDFGRILDDLSASVQAVQVAAPELSGDSAAAAADAA